MPTKVLHKLSATAVKNAKPKVVYSDSLESVRIISHRISDGGNLYLYVRKSGTKSWEFRFKNSQGKFTYLGLGSYPEISLKEAREQASICRLQVQEGKDPLEERKANEVKKHRERQNTFGKFTELFLEFESKSGNSIKTYNLKEARIRNHLNPAFGHLPLSGLTASVAIDGLKKYVDEDKLSLLSKLIELLNQIMDYAVILEKIEYSRLCKLHKAFPRGVKNHLPSLPYQELDKYLVKMSSTDMEFLTRGMFLLQTHTLVRSNEVATAKWADFNFEDMIWVIPGKIMKGKKNLPFKVPITPETYDILKQLEPFKDASGFVFPSNRSKSGHVDGETVNKAITQRAGYKGKMCAHGIRSMGSTTLNEEGFSERVVDMCLAHEVRGETEAAYNKAEYVEKRREIMRWWSKHVDALLPLPFKLENYSS